MTNTGENERETEVVQDGTGLPADDVVEIDHGRGIKSQWRVKAEGKTPPNPPIEVRPVGTDDDNTAHWAVIQQRTGAILAGGFEVKDDAIAKGIELAKEHRVELFVKNTDGKIGWRNSYGNDPESSPG